MKMLSRDIATVGLTFDCVCVSSLGIGECIKLCLRSSRLVQRGARLAALTHDPDQRMAVHKEQP